jgi:hypothetical protein
MCDENVRYLTSTLTPGWNRLSPGCDTRRGGDDPPVLFGRAISGFRSAAFALDSKENVKWSCTWIKGAAGPARRSRWEVHEAALER